jgi:hypothetical protein
MQNRRNESKLTKMSEGTQSRGKESNGKTEGERFRRELLSGHPGGQGLGTGSPFRGLDPIEKKELSKKVIENVSDINRRLQEQAEIVRERTGRENITVGSIENLLSSDQKDNTDSETVVGSPPQTVFNYFSSKEGEMGRNAYFEEEFEVVKESSEIPLEGEFEVVKESSEIPLEGEFEIIKKLQGISQEDYQKNKQTEEKAAHVKMVKELLRNGVELSYSPLDHIFPTEKASIIQQAKAEINAENVKEILNRESENSIFRAKNFFYNQFRDLNNEMLKNQKDSEVYKSIEQRIENLKEMYNDKENNKEYQRRLKKLQTKLLDNQKDQNLYRDIKQAMKDIYEIKENGGIIGLAEIYNQNGINSYQEEKNFLASQKGTTLIEKITSAVSFTAVFNGLNSNLT